MLALIVSLSLLCMVPLGPSTYAHADETDDSATQGYGTNDSATQDSEAADGSGSSPLDQTGNSERAIEDDAASSNEAPHVGDRFAWDGLVYEITSLYDAPDENRCAGEVEVVGFDPDPSGTSASFDGNPGYTT